MIKNPRYTRLFLVLDRILRHPMLQNVTLEAAIQYTVDFMHIVGTPEMFQDKEITLTLHNYRAELPCDLIAVNQVMDCKTHSCLRSMTDTFDPDGIVNGRQTLGYRGYREEDTFKVQNTILISSIKEGDIKVSYKSIPVDEEGYPLIPDNPTYLSALELYIKVQAFTILFDTGKIQAAVLQNAQTDYAWRVGQLQSEMNTPSESEMESLCRSWTTLLQRVDDFDNGWRHSGDREYLRRH